MHDRTEVLYVDVADYTGKLLCSLYDNNSDVSGQATDVFITYERNGWKELSFSLPSKCFTEDGTEEDNYRLDYIIADYHLRIVSEDGIDWFIINETGVRHEAFSKKTNVVAPHISQRLKNRALDLEFSISEGDNVGTADEFLKTILENTDWYPGRVAKFYEDDGETIKVRSFTAPKKTGALKLIQSLCELFEAKPVFYVDEDGKKKVDILPMNPFSKLKEGEIPDSVLPNADKEKYLVDSNVIELHYDKSIKNLERKINAENISTRLYGYGSYGDNVSKYCSIQTAKHDEYRYVIDQDYPVSEFKVTDKDGVVRYFTASPSAGDQLIWSMLDYNSRSYVWNEAEQVAYEVYSVPKTKTQIELTGEMEQIQNYVPFLSDYTYYRKVGLLTDEMLQSVARYQRNTIKYYQDIIDAQDRINTLNEQLSIVGVPGSGFLRLDISNCESTSEGSKLTINWSDAYPDGVIYRSDYLQKDIHYFGWHVAQNLKPNGMPTSGVASVIMVLHKDSDPVKWEKAFLKDIDGRTYQDADGNIYHSDYSYSTSEGQRPHEITVWGNITVDDGDSVYLFCVDGFTGKIGAKFTADETVVQQLESSTRIGKAYHPTIFVEGDEFPTIDFSSYGWLYQYDPTNYDTPGTLYFSWPERGDKKWQNVYITDKEPAVTNNAYYYNFKTCVLWHEENGQWVKLETVEEKTVAQQLGIVHMLCRQRDETYKGLYEKYTYQTSTSLPVGYYAFPTDFGYYWLFSTKKPAEANSVLTLDTIQKSVSINNDVENFTTAASYPYNTLTYPSKNDLDQALFAEGSVYKNDDLRNGNEMSTDRLYRSNFIPIWPNETYEYSMPENAFVVLYDSIRNYLGYVDLAEGTHSFSTASTLEYDSVLNPDDLASFKQAKYLKLVIPKDSLECGPDEIKDNFWIHIKDYDSVCFTNDIKYQILTPISHPEGANPVGINYLIKKFKEANEELYLEALPALDNAQKTLTNANAEQIQILGDILREGWWQDNSYVAGDEQRMYKDALDNLEKIAQPEITYTFDYLNLFESNKNLEFKTSEFDAEWPKIKVTDAAHLVDPELSVNQWAYIDKLRKCYDQKWKSTIEINTQLSLMGQHSFKDVMTRIAEVASETKAKQTIYDRAEIVSPDGTIDGDNISGEINTQNVPVSGGVSGWKTDSKGNFIMESADGRSAMKFSGSGLFIANGKNENDEWEWELVANGHGLQADTIRFGTMKGDRIETGTITADKLMANVGNALEIGSNKALSLFATVDGVRPTGTLKTTDAAIEIKAGQEDIIEEWKRYTRYNFGDAVQYMLRKYRCIIPHLSGDSLEAHYWQEYDGQSPAQINIGSGGSVNLIADNNGKIEPSINLVSGGAINAIAGGEINVVSGGNFTVSSGGNVSIEAGGNFTVGADNIKLDATGFKVSGTIESQSGTIGGWHIGSQHLGTDAELSKSSVGLRRPDMDPATDEVVFWAGSADRVKAPFKVYSSGKLEASDISIMSSDSEFIVAPSTDGESSTTTSINNGAISTANVTDSVFTGGEIHIGPKLDEEDQVVGYRFNVTDEGVATVYGTLTGTFEGTGTLSGSFSGTSSAGKDSNFGNLKVASNGDLYSNNNLMFGLQSDSPNVVWLQKNNTAAFSVSNTAGVTCTGLTTNGNASVTGTLGVTGATTLSTVTAVGATVNGNLTITGALTGTGTAKLNNLTVTGTFTNNSSRDAKEDIKPLEHRDAFDKLTPVSFRYKGDPQKHFGLIYEDTQNLYPEVCVENNGTKGISYTDLVSVLIKEVQDLRKRVSELERK